MPTSQSELDAEEYGAGRAETVLDDIAEENGRYTNFAAATEHEGDPYYIPNYDPQGEVLLIHKTTHEIFGVDVSINVYKTGQTWTPPKETDD